MHKLKSTNLHFRHLLSLLKQTQTKTQLTQIHAQMILTSFPNPNFLLLKSISLNDFPYSSLLFSRIPHPNDFAFNIMIRALTTTWNQHSLALEIYYRMKLSGLRPNNFTYPFVFISCAKVLGLIDGKMGHAIVVKVGLKIDGYVVHSLVNMYARCGEVGCARKVFDEIPERDLVSWNVMISGYSKMGFAREAVGLFGEMRERGVEPDEVTVVSVLGACGDLGDSGLGSWVEEEYVEKKGMEVSSFVGSALIDMYGKCGDLASSRRVFDGMGKKDVVTWNAMITGYAQNGASDEAIRLFNAMRETCADLNEVTIVVVLSACSSIGALDLGKWVATFASEKGFQYDVYVSSALIDMYAKCGSLDDAKRVFENTPHKNDVTWNAMISAFAFHGKGKEALSLFRKMSKADGGTKPDGITLVAVLSACVHAGLVDEGRQLFESMLSSFGLVPEIEHYSCMIDLLARAGLLYEAWDIIEKMPGKPDEIALGALLGACQKRRNVDIGERVMQLLLKAEPSNSGSYVISSKIYADSKRWDDSAKMRLLMKQRGLTKTPGCSWIEIEAQVHEFHAGDCIDENSMKLYKLLIQDMLREGYVPKASYRWKG